MTGIDAPPSGRARPLRCHGCVNESADISRACSESAAALEGVRAMWGGLANSQSQVLVWSLATAGGTVRTQQQHIYCSARLAVRSITRDLLFQGYHVPAVRHRDAFYQKLEDDRAAALGQK